MEGKTCNNSIGGKTYHTNLPNSTHSDGKIREECELKEFEKKTPLWCSKKNHDFDLPQKHGVEQGVKDGDLLRRKEVQPWWT